MAASQARSTSAFDGLVPAFLGTFPSSRCGVLGNYRTVLPYCYDLWQKLIGERLRKLERQISH